MTQPTQRTIGVVRVDGRGRVYLKRLATSIPTGAMYLVDVDDGTQPGQPGPSKFPETPGQPPKTIRLRLVETEGPTS